MRNTRYSPSNVMWLLVGMFWLCILAVDTAAEPRRGPVRIVFAGDVMFDNSPGHAIRHGTDPFAEFATILRGADISVCNLECAVARVGRQQRKSYVFLGRPECLPLLKRYFSAVSLANNHSGDYGKKGFLDELRLLEKEGLPYFGGGRNRRQARQPLILERRVMRVALLGYNDFPPESFAAGRDTPGTAWLVEKTCLAEIKAARERHRADVVIPFLHWGSEGEASPLAYQRDLAHRMIDAGADAVVGGHAHVTQTVDMYRGRPIIYSLGNFVFDYFPVDPTRWTGWLVRLTFDPATATSLETFVFEIDKEGIPHLLPESKEMLSAEELR